MPHHARHEHVIVERPLGHSCPSHDGRSHAAAPTAVRVLFTEGLPQGSQRLVVDGLRFGKAPLAVAGSGQTVHREESVVVSGSKDAMLDRDELAKEDTTCRWCGKARNAGGSVSRSRLQLHREA